jgi:hypothetical protein
MCQVYAKMWASARAISSASRWLGRLFRKLFSTSRQSGDNDLGFPARRLKLPEFQAAYRQARRAAFGQAVARLRQGTSAAATTLLKVLIDQNNYRYQQVERSEPGDR